MLEILMVGKAKRGVGGIIQTGEMWVQESEEKYNREQRTGEGATIHHATPGRFSLENCD